MRYIKSIKNSFIICMVKLKNIIKSHKYMSAIMCLFIISCIVGVIVFAEQDEYAGLISSKINGLSISDSSGKMIVGEDGTLTDNGKIESFDTLVLDLNYLLEKKDEKEKVINGRNVSIEARLETNSKIADISWYKSDINNTGSYEVLEDGKLLKVLSLDKSTGENNSQYEKLYMKLNNVENDATVNVTIKLKEATSNEEPETISRQFKVSSTLTNLSVKVIPGVAYKNSSMDFNGRYVPYGILVGINSLPNSDLKGKYFNTSQNVLLNVSQKEFENSEPVNLKTDDNSYFGLYDRKLGLIDAPNSKYDGSNESVYDSGLANLEKTGENEYTLKVSDLKTDSVYYKDNDGFIALGSYFVTAESKRITSTKEIPVTLTATLNDESDSKEVLNPKLAYGSKSYTLDFYNDTLDGLSKIPDDYYIAYGENVMLRSQFDYSSDGDLSLTEVAFKIPINSDSSHNNTFNLVNYSEEDEMPYYINSEYKNSIKVHYYNGDNEEVEFDDSVSYITYTIDEVKPGSKVDFRLMLMANALDVANNGSNVQLNNVSYSYKEDTDEINETLSEGPNILIKAFKARVNVFVNDSESDAIVDGSKVTTWSIQPSVIMPAATLITNAAKINDLASVYVIVDLPDEVNYVSNSEYNRQPSLSNNNKHLVYEFLGKQINDSYDQIEFDTMYDINTENGKELNIKVTIAATAYADELQINDTWSTVRKVTYKNENNIRFALQTNNRVISRNKEFEFTANIYNIAKTNISTIIVLPYNDIENSNDFSGSYSIENIPVEAYCTNAPYSQLISNSDNLLADENLNWASCSSMKSNYNEITAIKLSSNLEKLTESIKIKPVDNKSDDAYVINTFLYNNDTNKKIYNEKLVVRVVSKKITGIVWEDFDSNGIMGKEEKKVSDVIIKLCYIDTDECIDEVASDINGKYSFSDVQNGNYYLSANYNTSKYGLTSYRVNDNKKITSSFNSFSSEEELSPIIKTDMITITDDINTVNNVNLGLSLRKIFTVKLSKYISNATITNKLGVSNIKEFGNVSFAKLDVKDISNLTIKVVYTIELENTGYYPGYIYTIKDYIPDGMTFNETYKENAGWTLNKNGYIENSTLFDELISAGGKKYLTVAFDVSRKEAGSFINYASVDDEDLHILVVDNNISDDMLGDDTDE